MKKKRKLQNILLNKNKDNFNKRKRLTALQRNFIACSQGWKCNICKELLGPMIIIDHIHAICMGGDDDKENVKAKCEMFKKYEKINDSNMGNFQALCSKCHHEKTTLEMLQLIEKEQDKIFNVERIHAHFRKGGKLYFEVEWEGFPDKKDFTYEPIENLEMCSVFHEYIKKHFCF
jgi:5-methylcytosine-specific restriction endonuclease McrA